MADMWHRDLWWELVWNSEGPRPNERAVAYTYSRYAGRTKTAHVTLEEMQRRTGIKSRQTIVTTTKSLVDAGWLKEVDPPSPTDDRRHQWYELTFPDQFRKPEKGGDG